MTDPITYPCGCVNAPDMPSGVLRSVEKCPKHKARQRRPETLERAYYEELGLLKGETPHVAQLEEALGPIPWAQHMTVASMPPIPLDRVVEIGCGASPYVRRLIDREWDYVGIEPSLWAADWMHETHGVFVRHCDFESMPDDLRLPFILAAHVFEHLVDAPGAIVKCADWLVSGGELWIVVPDDSDPRNPDHLWFFTPTTLRSCLESAGLVVERMAVRKYVPHERFIYCRARKP